MQQAYFILYFRKSHNTPLVPPPQKKKKNLRSLCFQFLLGHLHVPREIKCNHYAKFWWGEHDVLWDLRK